MINGNDRLVKIWIYVYKNFQEMNLEIQNAI